MSDDMMKLESASALARAYASGAADPVDVAERCLATATATPHAFITLTRERALREATAARSRWRAGAPLSPLDGVPIAWKDMFDVEGLPTTMGAAIHASDAPAKCDAAVVAAAAAAGMVMIGKTNLTEFAYSVLGLNPHFGTPCAALPGATRRVPGGSSSGSAVAVKVGAAPYGIATDTAGSARVPAAFNGLVGYRASAHRYPKDGLAPLAPTLDTFGIIATTVDDVALLDAVLRGAARDQTPDVAPTLVIDDVVLDDARVAASVRADMTAAISRLRETGLAVLSCRVGALHETFATIERHGWLGAAEAYALHRAVLDSPDAERLDQRVRRRLAAGAGISAADVAALRAARTVLMARAADELAGVVLVTPTVAHPPPELAAMEADPDLFATVNLASLRLTAPGSFLDLPSVSLPIGAGEDGLWSGLQLSVASGDDERLLRAAAAVEAALARPGPVRE